jgi:hypothetical protein
MRLWLPHDGEGLIVLMGTRLSSGPLSGHGPHLSVRHLACASGALAPERRCLEGGKSRDRIRALFRLFACGGLWASRNTCMLA